MIKDDERNIASPEIRLSTSLKNVQGNTNLQTASLPSLKFLVIFHKLRDKNREIYFLLSLVTISPESCHLSSDFGL